MDGDWTINSKNCKNNCAKLYLIGKFGTKFYQIVD